MKYTDIMPKKSDHTIDATGTVNACSGPAGKSRRGFLQGSLGLIAGAAGAQFLPSGVAAQQRAAGAATLERLTNANGRPILLKDGMVLSMDRQVGDFEKADVLIDGTTIARIAPAISAGDAEVVDCAGTIVMPGFITTHHHQYQTLQRSIIADGLLQGAWPQESYGSV
ncbi:MAG: hypothetical protein ACRDF6_09855, partial [bacterium]